VQQIEPSDAAVMLTLVARAHRKRVQPACQSKTNCSSVAPTLRELKGLACLRYCIGRAKTARSATAASLGTESR
jgi:hypothetical protein